MIISKEATIADISIIDLRRFLKYIGDRTWKTTVIADFFHTDPQVSRRLLQGLLAEGVIRVVNATQLQMTTKGLQLSIAALRQHKRETALRDLQVILDETEEINRLAEAGAYAHYITKLVLFGSLLDPKRQHVIDIDLAIEVVRKTEDDGKQAELEDAMMQCHRVPEKWLSGTRSVRPQTLVHRHLESLSSLLRLTALTNLGGDAPSKIIYQYHPAVEAEEGIHERWPGGGIGDMISSPAL